MRVALVSPGWPPSAFANGIVTYVALLREGLKKTGVDTRILASSVKGTGLDADIVDLARCGPRFPLAEKVRNRLFWHFRPDEFVSFLGAQDVMNGLRHLKPDFSPELLEMEESFGCAGRVSKHIRVPLVMRLHGPWFLNGAALGAPRNEVFRRRVAIEGKAIARAKAVTSPSKDLLDRVKREYEIELPRGEVIPNPAPAVDKGARWKLTSCDPDLVLFVGRFDRHKGGDLVIDAFSEIAANRPRLKLMFIGPDRGVEDGQGGSLGLQEYLLKRVPDLSVRSRIQHLGQMSAKEIPKWRQKARVTIVASRFEVFGMVTLEALAFGGPLVASRAGGIPEIVVHEENGFLFEKGNASDLAHWLATMLDQPELSAKLGERAATDAELRFGPDVIASQTKQCYERVIAENGSRARPSNFR